MRAKAKQRGKFKAGLKAKPRLPRVPQKPKQPDESFLSLKGVVEALVESDPDFEIIAEELGEPDAALLAQQEEEFREELPIDSHELAAELAEDPVRLYLREIGQVRLLDSDSEFRLATLIEADRMLAAFQLHSVHLLLSLVCLKFSIYRAMSTATRN